MKNCKSINLLFDEMFQGELKGDNLQVFKEHLSKCNNCNTEYNEFKNTLALMGKRERPEIKEEFWDNYWDNLSEKAFLDKSEDNKGIKSFLSLIFIDQRKFALPTAALILILFGLLLGKILFTPGSDQVLLNKNEMVQSNPIDNSRYFTMVNNHIDDIKPIFAEYSNYQASHENESEFLSVKKDLLKKLLLQNYLLKRIAVKKEDPQLKVLIEDLQLILLELINSSSTEIEKINSVKNMMDGSDVIFKMNMLKKKNKLFKKSELGETI